MLKIIEQMTEYRDAVELVTIELVTNNPRALV